jgi:hypothetical protein
MISGYVDAIIERDARSLCEAVLRLTAPLRDSTARFGTTSAFAGLPQ